jgi:hypothetical protein
MDKVQISEDEPSFKNKTKPYFRLVTLKTNSHQLLIGESSVKNLIFLSEIQFNPVVVFMNISAGENFGFTLDFIFHKMFRKIATLEV